MNRKSISPANLGKVEQRVSEAEELRKAEELIKAEELRKAKELAAQAQLDAVLVEQQDVKLTMCGAPPQTMLIPCNKHFLPLLMSPVPLGDGKHRKIVISKTREVYVSAGARLTPGDQLPTAEHFRVFVYLMGLAIRKGSPTIKFPSRREVLDHLGYTDCKDNYDQVYLALDSYFTLHIRFAKIEYVYNPRKHRDDRIVHETGISGLIKEMSWPRTYSPKEDDVGVWIWFNPEFFQLCRYHARFIQLLDIAKLVEFKKNAKAMSLYLWLLRWIDVRSSEYTREIPIESWFVYDWLGWERPVEILSSGRPNPRASQASVITSIKEALNIIAFIDPAVSFELDLDIWNESFWIVFKRKPIPIELLTEALLKKLPPRINQLITIGYTTDEAIELEDRILKLVK